MNSILSIFETAVADYLLLASIAAAALVVVAWGIIKVRRVKGPANRHMIWLFTLVAIVLLPAIWLHGPKLRLTVLPADSRVVETTPQPVNVDFTAEPMVKSGPGVSANLPPENAAPEADASFLFRLPPIMTLLAIGWGIGFLLMLIRLTFGGVKLRNLLQTAVPVTDAMGLDNGGRRIIDLLLSSKVDCPVCFGLLRPVILMPTKMYDKTSQEDLRMILRHELAHIERKDCWINLFQRIVEAVLFFHPLVWYASFQLTQQREELCDQHVIAGGESPENYVEMLGRIARQGFEKRALQAVALFEGRLLSRVKSLLSLDGSVQIRASRRAAGVLAIAAMLCLAVGSVRLEAKSETVSTSITGADKRMTASFRPQEEETLGLSGNRPVGNCSISGRVISAITGEPVGNATVYLFYMGTHDPVFIKAAGDGSFSFDDIPSGNYSLSVINTDGFKSASYDPENNAQHNGRDSFSFFSLSEGEKRSDVLFQLEPVPENIISGRVLGEDGTPVKESGLVVKALVRGNATDRYPALYDAGEGQVAADGSYCLAALGRDPVLVMVEAPSVFVEGEHSFPPCYYPGTISRDQATWVNFNGGVSRENMDIQLVANGNVVLEGRVVDEATGAPVPDTIVAVNHSDMLNAYVSTITDDLGYYHFQNIGAEELLVHFDARTSGHVRQRIPVVMAAGETVRLDVGLKQAAEISGFFLDEKGVPYLVSENAYGYTNTVDPADPMKDSCTRSYSVSTSTETEDGWIETRHETLFVNGEGYYPNGDWRFPTQDSFLVEAVLPGETTLRFLPLEQGVEVKKIIYKGEDILEREEMSLESENVAKATLETRPGEVIEGISIVLGPVGDPSSSL